MKSSATFTAAFRMPRYSDGDPYLDPVTGVLRNRLDIADEATLEEIEADLVATRSYELSQSPLEGSFDLAHLQAIHRRLFADVYEWAGELRTIDISKGGNRFALWAHIESARPADLRAVEERKPPRRTRPGSFRRSRCLLSGRIECAASLPRRKREGATRIHQPSCARERLLRRVGKHQSGGNAEGCDSGFQCGRVETDGSYTRERQRARAEPGPADHSGEK
jgi:hypothetical protein